MAKVSTLREIKAKTPDVTINVIQSLSGMDGDKYTKQYLANVEGLANHIANDLGKVHNIMNLALDVFTDRKIAKENGMSNQDVKARDEKLLYPVLEKSLGSHIDSRKYCTALRNIGSKADLLNELMGYTLENNPLELPSDLLKLGEYGIRTLHNKLTKFENIKMGKESKETEKLSDYEQVVRKIANKLIESIPTDKRDAFYKMLNKDVEKYIASKIK